MCGMPLRVADALLPSPRPPQAFGRIADKPRRFDGVHPVHSTLTPVLRHTVDTPPAPHPRSLYTGPESRPDNVSERLQKARGYDWWIRRRPFAVRQRSTRSAFEV